MVTPRGWGAGRRRREGVGKSPHPSWIIYSYIHISFYSKERRAACPSMRHFCKRQNFACDLRAKLCFMSRGGLHLPPKNSNMFSLGSYFFPVFFFPRLFVSKVRDTVVRKLCSFFSLAFISIVFPCDLLLNERQTKNTHTQTRLFFACKVCVRPYWYTCKRFLRQLSR